MKKALLLITAMLALSATAQVTQGKYWIDDGRAVKGTMSLSGGEAVINVDISGLRPGMYTLHSRVSDGTTWGAIATHLFVKPFESDLAGEPVGYRYWIDGGELVSGSLSGGEAVINVDISDLRPGMHTLHSRVSDGTTWGTIATHLFVKPFESDLAGEPVGYRYWIDGGEPVSGSLSGGEAVINVDISGLRPGMHTLHSRVSDGTTWGTIATHLFVKPFESDLAGEPVGYRYWIDNNIEDAVEGTMGSDGVVVLDAMLEGLTPGLHTINARVKADNGLWSAVVAHLFIVTNPELVRDRVMTGYRYWFNTAVPTRVDISPTDEALALSDIIIPVDNVVPNAIHDGYTLDVEREMVTVIDDVSFGFQVVNAEDLGQPVYTVLEAYPVAVDPQVELLKHKQAYEFEVPGHGEIRGFRVDSVTVGSNVSFALTAIGATVDFFDNDGNRLDATRSEADGTALYRLRPPKGSVYAMVHTVTEPVASLTATWRVQIMGDLNDDARINVGDVNIALNDIITTGGTTLDYDVNGDGTVNVGDVNSILNIIIENSKKDSKWRQLLPKACSWREHKATSQLTFGPMLAFCEHRATFFYKI